MVRGVNQGQHRAPGVAYKDRLGATAFSDEIIQILHVRRDRQRSVATAALMGLKHAPPFTQSSGKRCQVAGRGGSAVHGDQRLDPDPVLPHEKIGHRIRRRLANVLPLSRGGS
jgi:hypothetical protein